MTEKPLEKRRVRTNIFKVVRAKKEEVGQLLDRELKLFESSKVNELREYYNLLDELEKNFLNELRHREKDFNRLTAFYANNVSNKKTCESIGKGLTIAVFNKQIQRISEHMYALFGDSLVSALEQDDIRLLKETLSLREKGLEAKDFLLTEFLVSLPPVKESWSLNMSDCVKELSVLKLYSDAMMCKQIAACDREKLGYLLSIITSTGGNQTYRRSILEQFLRGEVVDTLGKELDFTEFIELLKSEEL